MFCKRQLFSIFFHILKRHESRKDCFWKEKAEKEEEEEKEENKEEDQQKCLEKQLSSRGE